MCTVWIVLKLDDYDERDIVAVCSTEEKARAVLQFYEHKYGMRESYWISKYTVDEEIQKSITELQYELDETNDLKNLLDNLKSLA